MMTKAAVNLFQAVFVRAYYWKRTALVPHKREQQTLCQIPRGHKCEVVAIFPTSGREQTGQGRDSADTGMS